jgi:nucleotide-binding universal stress UspA family protein
MADKNVVIAVTDVGVLRKALPSMVEWTNKLTGNVKATLLYVAEVHDMEAATPVLEDMRIKKAQLRELAEEFAQHGIEAKIKLKAGRLAREIVREARETGAFAILMSTDGRAGLSRVLAASVIEEVIRRAPCPVVVFKPKLLRFTDKIALTLSSRIKKLSASAALDQS